MTMWWDPYNLFRDAKFTAFWQGRLAGSKRRLLFIVGAGFDPRVLGPAKEIIAADPAVARHCVAIDMSNGYETDSSAASLGRQNREGLDKLFPGASLEVRRLVAIDTDRIRDVSRGTSVLFADLRDLIEGYTDVIVDISALPRLVYLTLLNMLLVSLVDPTASSPLGSEINLHVVYAEAAEIDSAISKFEIETELAPIRNLTIRLDEEASLNWPTVWFPVLAEDMLEQLTRIADRTNPDEICPVLPAQAANPRRGDAIIERLGELLFDRLNVDSRDILRATESNPFQLYRSLIGTMARYEDSLKLFGGVRFVLSPLSSKGLSIGCLLAAFEKRALGDRNRVRVGLAHVESKRYDATSLPETPRYELVSAWLTGECYHVDPLPDAETEAVTRRSAD